MWKAGKETIIKLIKLLTSDEAGGDVAIKNNMGITPLELAGRIRNKQDKQTVVDMLTKIKEVREERLRAEINSMTKGLKYSV